MNYTLFYQICKIPIQINSPRYKVRKYIFSDSRLINSETYTYSERNLNKLNKEINQNGYQFEYIESDNFDNIPYPNVNLN